MPRHRPTPPGKTRTRQHVIAVLSINYLERNVLLCGYTLQRIQADYGYDLVMWTYNARGEIESGITYFQVKATDHLRLHKNGHAILWPITRRDLRLWLRDTPPVILVVYDGARDKAYWLYVQAYFAERAATELFAAGETITVHVPTGNRISRRSIRTIAQYTQHIEQQVRGKVQHHA